MALPRKLKYCNVFVDGVSFVGEAVELVLPKLTQKSEDFRSGGMPGPVDINLGLEKLEAEVTFGGPVDEVLRGFQNPKISDTLIRFMGSMQRDDSGQVDAFEIEMRGRWTELDFGSWKAGENSEFKTKAALTYYKLMVNGETRAEIDLVNHILIIDGKDLYEAHRSAIGLAG